MLYKKKRTKLNYNLHTTCVTIVTHIMFSLIRVVTRVLLPLKNDNKYNHGIVVKSCLLEKKH